MPIFTSPGTRNARDLLRKIDKISLDFFLDRNFEDRWKGLTGPIGNVNQIFQAIGNTAKKYITDFSNQLNNPPKEKQKTNIQIFKEAIEKQAKSSGTKSGGLFYKLVYTKTNSIMKSDNDWSNENKLRELEKHIRVFLLAKKDGDITETVSDDGDEARLGQLANKYKKDESDKKYERMSNSHIIEKLKSRRLSNRLKVFIALVLWKHLFEKIKAQATTVTPHTHNANENTSGANNNQTPANTETDDDQSSAEAIPLTVENFLESVKPQNYVGELILLEKAPCPPWRSCIIDTFLINLYSVKDAQNHNCVGFRREEIITLTKKLKTLKKWQENYGSQEIQRYLNDYVRKVQETPTDKEYQDAAAEYRNEIAKILEGWGVQMPEGVKVVSYHPDKPPTFEMNLSNTSYSWTFAVPARNREELEKQIGGQGVEHDARQIREALSKNKEN